MKSFFMHSWKDSMHSLTYRSDLTSICGFNLGEQSIPQKQTAQNPN